MTKAPKTSGDYEVGNKKPPKNRQFGQPEGNKPGHGFWRKEDTGRYKLQQMMKMSRKELVELVNNDDAPLFERKIAKNMLKNDEWKVVESMINQESGMPKQEITQTNIELKPILPKKAKE